MPKKIVFLFIYCLLLQRTNAQLKENFDDSDFTVNPIWQGNAGDWKINESLQLQSNNTTANSTFYLSTANALATAAQWEFDVHLAFNTSSANYVDVFLTASTADLTNSNNTGYFVRIGNTDDEISLYRKDTGGLITKIINGADDMLNHSNNTVKIKVTRSQPNEWNLFTDPTTTGLSFVSEGRTIDSTYNSAAFFGFLIRQSTAGFFQKHFFDNIEIKAYEADTTPPAIISVNAVSDNAADVLFSEAADTATAQTLTNYFVNDDLGNPVTAVRDAVNAALVHLTFSTAFAAGAENTITINNVNDLAGNTLHNGIAVFSFYKTRAFDVVIDEILSDPTPVVGLPDAEFVEIKNTASKDINLAGWKITTSSAESKTFPSYKLSADSFVIITGSNPDLFTNFGKVLQIPSFPALINSGTTLSLISKEGAVVHSVSYNNTWFQNDVKSGGGWSLEMIDTKNPCTGANNWKASTDIKGGTPGAKNSIDALNSDNTAPALLRAAAIDSLHIIVTFSESVDSAKAAFTLNYKLSNAINVLSAVAIAPSFTKVQLTLSAPLIINKIYIITANDISDCSGNIIQAVKTVRVGLPAKSDSLDIVINEVLFNPKPAGVDYVEIYNRTNKIFNLKDLLVANRAANNTVSSLHQLTADDILMFPGDFFVLSENGALVKQNYAATNPDNFIDFQLPSFPDNEGVVVLLNEQEQIIDELHYYDKWHFALTDNEEGISLERTAYNKPTQNKENWTSAASTAGFGTPSYQNSQSGEAISVKGNITVTPKTFSPDNDGFEDFTTINYQMSQAGNVANITIFDAAGRPVKAVAKNATLGLSGSFKWDGLNDKSIKAPVGIYVIHTEIFNLNGRKKSFKNTAVVAAMFR